MLRLVLPDTKFLSSYLEALREGYQLGVRPISSEDEIKEIEKDPFSHFKMLNIQGGYFTPEDGVKRKRVPDNMFWLVDDDEFIGAVNIRYALNDFLEIHAGHLGYGIRPSKKRQGYATKMVGLALSILRKREVDKCMITAGEKNIGSWKAIESNGGVMVGTVENIFQDDAGLTRQYWIDLKGMCG